MKFETYCLGEVCTFIDYRGKTPPKTTSGIPLVTAKIVKNGIIQEPQEFIAENYYDEWMRRGIPKKESVVFTTEAPLGEVARIRTDKKLAFAQRIIVLEPKTKQLRADYLFYALQDHVLKSRIEARSTGTTVIGIKAAELKKVEIDLPALQEQEKIAAILCSLDDKIELNNKINENLEQQAQAIYQEWFGNINMEKGQGTLADICTYSKDRVSVSELNVSTYFSTENMLPGKAGATEASSLPTTTQTTACHVGDTLISNIRPYFKKIVYCHEECGCSTDVLCFVPVHPKYSAYLYSTLYADKFFDFMVAGSKGTKMPRGDKQQIMTYPMTLPTDTELERFNSVAVPILTQIQNSRNENKRLSLLRDTLLPKLISGEIYI